MMLMMMTIVYLCLKHAPIFALLLVAPSWHVVLGTLHDKQGLLASIHSVSRLKMINLKLAILNRLEQVG